MAAVAPNLEQRRVSTTDATLETMKSGGKPPPLPGLQPPAMAAAHSTAAPINPFKLAADTKAAAASTAKVAVVAPPLPAAPPSAVLPALPPILTATAAPTFQPQPVPHTPAPESAQADGKPRRRAGPSRDAVAANDDVPTIGGLIYALNQKPSTKPFKIAAIAGGAWFVLAAFFAFLMISAETGKATGLIDLLAKPAVLISLATTVLPIAVAFGVAWLLYHAEDLRLRSSAMTEVAIRLAEPDRAAEQAIASLGQSVRKQVGYMNEAISQAIGRAGELEAMVHNEVSSMETSFQQNETRIRTLLTHFSTQRDEMTGTSTHIHQTLKAISDEVPALIEKLSDQQMKLSRIVENAGHNLIALETQLTSATGQLEGSLATRTEALRGVLTDTADRLTSTLTDKTDQLKIALTDGTEQVRGLLTDGQERLQSSFTDNAGQVQTMLVDRTNHLQTVLDEYTSALHASLGARTGQLQSVFEEFTLAIDSTLEARSQGMNEVLIRQVDRMDASMIDRTNALDAAFATRLQVLDESIQRSSLMIDGAVGDKAKMLTSAMETHARQLSETLSRQSQSLDDSLLQGINSVRRTSENITRQSVKAIEGLSGQADMLRNVSENLLSQIGTVTSRFENQGQSILRAANSLESANHRIDQTLQARHRDLTDTLGRVTESSEHLGQQMLTYKSTIDSSLSDVTLRAKSITEEMTRTAQTHTQQALTELQKLKAETDQKAGTALQSLRSQVSTVSREMQDHVGALSSRLTQTTDELRQRSRHAQEELEREQTRLRAEAQKLPEATRDSVDGMRRMLAEQMRALDQVQQIAGRAQADVSPPARAPEPMPPARALAPPPQAPAAPSAPSLVAAIAAAAGPAPNAAPSGWSLGDLLARASTEEAHPVVAEPIVQPPVASYEPAPINLEQIAGALDPQTAGAIWARFRSGQRGILVRSIYSAEGRGIFDDVQRRCGNDAGFKTMIERFMAEFEKELREIEARDLTGQALQQHLVSSGGRVYLFLAHASGRLN